MAADLPVNGFPGQSAGVEINLGGDHGLTPADILFRALPKLMQPTQTLEISISVLPNFVYSMRQRSSFSLSAEHRDEAELAVVPRWARCASIALRQRQHLFPKKFRCHPLPGGTVFFTPLRFFRGRGKMYFAGL